MRRLVRVMLLGGALSGCAGADGPDGLLNVADFAPRRAEVGDRLEVIGSGFPEGKPATVTFKGDVFRPGQPPDRGVEIVASASSSSQNRITFFLTDEIQAKFCSKGESADHATFHGDVVAALAPRTSAAPPVTGTVHDVEIDFAGPAVANDLRARRESEGKAAAEFIGVRFEGAASHAGDDPPGRFVIDKVAPAGPADRAGLLPGDRIESVEGVRVNRVSDLAFSGVTRWAKVFVRRGAQRRLVERSVDVQGFRPATPRDLASAAVLVGIAVFALLFSFGPVARLLAFLARRVASRLRGSRGAGPFGVRRLWSSLSELGEGDTERAPALIRVIPYFLFLVVSAGATTVCFGRALVLPDLDLGLVVVANATLLTLVALMSGGWRGPRSWSIASGMKSGFAVLSCELPILAALGSVVVCTGNVRLGDIVAEQSVVPWGWNAFRNPVLFLAFVLLVAASVPRSSRTRGTLAEADLESSSQRESLLAYVEWGHLLVVSTVGCMLFLGGWRTPDALLFAGPIWASVSSALVLQLKSWSVLGVIVFLRWAIPALRADQLGSLWWRWVLPAVRRGARFECGLGELDAHCAVAVPGKSAGIRAVRVDRNLPPGVCSARATRRARAERAASPSTPGSDGRR